MAGQTRETSDCLLIDYQFRIMLLFPHYRARFMAINPH